MPFLAGLTTPIDHPSFRAVVSAFSERAIAWYRLLVLALIAGMYEAALFVAQGLPGQQDPLVVRIVLGATALLAVALIVVSRVVDRSWHHRLAMYGSAIDYLAIGALLWLELSVFAPIIVALPVITVVNGIRFGYRALLLGMGLSVAIVYLALEHHAVGVGWATAVTYLALVLGIPLFLHRIIRLLREISVRATDASTAKSRFLATMSHELRTPLHAIITTGTVLSAEPLTPSQLELVRTLDVNAKTLLHLVGDVLDIASIESGKVLIREAPFRLRMALSNVRFVIEPQARSKGLTCHVVVADRVPEMLYGDGNRVEQVLINLMGNAVKYTERGGVRLEVDLAPAGKAPAQIEFRVIDTGPGIPTEAKRRVFEPFYQLSQGEARRFGGTGLGLSIVRMISDRMGGELSVDDNPQGGTILSWSVALPEATEEQAQHVPLELQGAELFEAHRKAVRPQRVLIIEDQPPNRVALAMMLERAGHQTAAAADGPTGLKMLRGGRFDLVLLDLHMPGMSGWEVLEEIARQPGLSHAPPICILSAEVSVEALDAARHAGARSYLTKPIVAQDLLQLLAGLPRVTVIGADQNPSLEKTRATYTDMKELLDSIVEALQEQQQALVLAHSLADRSAVAEHLHAIKGMAGQFGLDHLYETIKLASVAYKDGPDQDATIVQVNAAVGQALAYLDAQPERQGAKRNGTSTAS